MGVGLSGSQSVASRGARSACSACWTAGSTTRLRSRDRAPPPEPPLHLKFTCKACSHDISPDDTRCGWCGEQMWGVDH